jgi:NAD(P)-dependent dehydrogenase (short-subunit alcohol dehydrogenase family)
MRRVFITGSADGLGLMSARLLAEAGHKVTLHARNAARAQAVTEALPTAQHVVVGDVATIAQMRSVAEQATTTGAFDAVIHNVAVGIREPRSETADGLEHVFAINVLAPYLITAAMPRPGRLIYLSSSMSSGANPSLQDPHWKHRRWNGAQAYANSKLYVMMLALGIARRWPDVLVNSVEPGWVPTKMGGPAAPDELELGPVTQVWLAVSNDPEAAVTGRHFFHQKIRATYPEARSTQRQDALLAYCAQLSGTPL